MKRMKPGFSFTFSSFFCAISTFAGFIFGGQEGSNFEYLYVYTGLGGFIGGYLVSSWLIVKPNNYNISRLIISGFIIGFVSPYTSWLIAAGFHSEFDNETVLTFLESFIEMILTPAGFAFLNLFFFGWLIIPLAIGTLFFTKTILKSRSL